MTSLWPSLGLIRHMQHVTEKETLVRDSLARKACVNNIKPAEQFDPGLGTLACSA
ncbi:hypothetical protein PAXRUDRAFT_827542 [Paxillus rubicundulus Ve08.2h10]|uniref:Unplaced genomic scaffold scaffold_255, whole genome shotgun sequence n=1 Tax=Paxillus rubicundulus Ve08.2h10 TaxID=930991 RepID=A0A0D0DXS0_9AGAM|nr:hypothetical protein PAXRUDRAFT_827542 [Paxillus rubicundulus Ve08.2h10]